jgi:hypothetical protein
MAMIRLQAGYRYEKASGSRFDVKEVYVDSFVVCKPDVRVIVVIADQKTPLPLRRARLADVLSWGPLRELGPTPQELHVTG